MKIVICISDYVDTVDVLIDGIKIDIKKLSFFSKAKFECELESGVHEITVVKRSWIMDRDWKKIAFFDWLFMLFGVNGHTLAEMELDKRKIKSKS